MKKVELKINVKLNKTKYSINNKRETLKNHDEQFHLDGEMVKKRMVKAYDVKKCTVS